MFLCSTGCADCIQLLAEHRADFTKIDYHGRGCLQLAQQNQSENKVAYHWLMKNMPGLPKTNAKGRAMAEKCRGAGAIKGYEPQKGTWKGNCKWEGKDKRKGKCRGKGNGRGRYRETP